VVSGLRGGRGGEGGSVLRRAHVYAYKFKRHCAPYIKCYGNFVRRHRLSGRAGASDRGRSEWGVGGGSEGPSLFANLFDVHYSRVAAVHLCMYDKNETSGAPHELHAEAITRRPCGQLSFF
jgi:hypothetical protein